MAQNKKNKQFFNLLKIFQEFLSNFHVPHEWQDKNNFTIFHSNNMFGTKEILYQIQSVDSESRTFASTETDITYKLNKFGFRSDNFENLNSEYINVITAGCSNTFGHEMPNEIIWPRLLERRMNKNKNVKIHNLGVSGLETFRIIRNCYSFVENYGKPDYIFLLLPPVQRFLVLDKKHNFLSVKQDPVFTRSIDEISKTFFKKKSQLSSNVINNILVLKNFESFCKINNIKLLWFCWDRNSQKIYEFLNFNNLIKTETIEHNINNITINFANENHKYWDWAADGDHQGLKFHMSWSDIFYNELKDNDNTRD
jgi:hypothetical protein